MRKRQTPKTRGTVSALPDVVGSLERYVSMAEFSKATTLSTDTIRRRAGLDLPPLHELTPGRKAMKIADVRAWERGERPWQQQKRAS